MPPRCAILPPVPVPYREPLFAALAERGRVEPRVIYLSGGQPGWDQRPDWFPERHGYPAQTLRSWQRPRAGRSPVSVPRGLGAALRRTRPECVVTWEFGPATWRSLAWARPRHVPVVVFSELTPAAHDALSPLQRRVHALLAPRMTGFVVASSQGVTRLERLGVDRARISVALQGADLDAFAAVAGRERAARPVRILTVGRLVEDKNLAALIRAFATCGFEPGEAELVVCGSGPLDAELRALAGEGVRFEGYAAPAELPALYASAHAAALVSTYEPFGVTMREAAAAGLPLLCSRVAGAAGDVAVEGENALLVDPAREDEIAAALARLVREPGLREGLAAGSRAVTERHPPSDDVDAWEEAIIRAARG